MTYYHVAFWLSSGNMSRCSVTCTHADSDVSWGPAAGVAGKDVGATVHVRTFYCGSSKDNDYACEADSSSSQGFTRPGRMFEAASHMTKHGKRQVQIKHSLSSPK